MFITVKNVIHSLLPFFLAVTTTKWVTMRLTKVGLKIEERILENRFCNNTIKLIRCEIKFFMIVLMYFFQNIFSRLREEEEVFVNELLNFIQRVILVFKVS